MKVKRFQDIYFNKKMGNWNREFKFNYFSYDSRDIKKNTLFLAHKGEHYDANKDVIKAINKGASAVIAETADYFDKNIEVPVLISDDVKRTIIDIVKYLRNDNKEQKIIGITGTVGKTTTKDILYSVLSVKHDIAKTEGNLNTEWGVPKTYLSNINKKINIIEMGMDHPDDIKKLTKAVIPDYTILTNITPVHLLYMEDMQTIYLGKTDIFRYSKKNSFDLMNGDNKFKKRAKKEFDNLKFYGLNEGHDYRIDILSENNKIEFKYDGEKYSAEIWGRFNLYNILPALIIGKKLGLTKAEIQKGLDNIILSSKRMEVVEKNDRVLINDSYNASPEAVKNIIDEVKIKYKGLKKIFFLGDMLELGKFSMKYHEEIIEYLNSSVKNKDVYFVGKEFLNFEDKYEDYKFFKNKNELINKIENISLDGDIYIFKGSRSMQIEKIYENILRRI